jgi:hypothetical protein
MVIRVRTHVRTGQNAPGITTAFVYTYNFLASPSLPATLSLTRSTTGTVFDSSGVMQTAAIDTARFENVWNGSSWAAAGLLLEESRTMANYSSATLGTAGAGNWLDTGTGVASLTAGTALNGAQEAYNLIPNATSGAHAIYRGNGTFPNTVTIWVHSVYAKPSGYTKFGLRESATTGANAQFNASGAGSVLNTFSAGFITTSNAKIANVASGYWRGSVEFNPGANAVQQTMGLLVFDAGYAGAANDPLSSYSYSGNGTSGITFEHPQMETGANPTFPTSYFPAISGSTTRGADALTSAGALTTQLAAGPSVWEMEDLASGTISRTSFAAGAFTFPINKRYRSFAVYPAATDTSPYLTVGGSYG